MNTETMIRDANPVRTGELPTGDSPRARATLDAILRSASGAAGARRIGPARSHWLSRFTAAGRALGAVLMGIVTICGGGWPGAGSGAVGRPVWVLASAADELSIRLR